MDKSEEPIMEPTIAIAACVAVMAWTCDDRTDAEACD